MYTMKIYIIQVMRQDFLKHNAKFSGRWQIYNELCVCLTFVLMFSVKLHHGSFEAV